MNAWLWLLLAGGLEVAWVFGLERSEGLQRPLVALATGVAMIGSVVALGAAVRDIPVSTAYPVWVGLGIAGSTAVGVGLLGEQLTLARAAFLVLLSVGVIGLKATST